ncbi:MAG: ATP-dependent helicase [Marinobacter sp.]|jgi:hypothetical protein|nr:ATP-dependent helicase [Marinobacter sp.]
MTTDLIRVEYARNGKSKKTNELGMREMQARAYEARGKQYLLLKAPPASGKSRALMFLSLDKLINQGVRKAIVAVPETSIGASFDNTALSEHGFYADWVVRPEHNLCTPGSEGSDGKIDAFRRFMHRESTDVRDRVLICTHATLRFAFEKLATSEFDDTLLAIDEFHHASADRENRLGNLLDRLMKHSSAHVVAMTGSYFRGDTVPILLPEDEEKFSRITYTYYEQLNGYEHLRSLGIGYHFYTGRYMSAIKQVLDPGKKTIIHIPNVNSRESTKDKFTEVDQIVDALGTVEKTEPDTGILVVRVDGGKRLRVANLVDDTVERPKVMAYLRQAKGYDDIDIIIALGMAKEGFDWPWCEHVLTIGYRNSMTEVVQIIGRATRDAPGKNHAQFTNLIAQPDAEDEDVKFAVNNMLKAITVSLLMEQVMAPNFNFRPRDLGGEPAVEGPGSIEINGIGGNKPSPQVQQALDNSSDILAAFIQQPEAAAAITGTNDPEVMTQAVLTRVIQERCPQLTSEEVENVRMGIATQMALSASGGLFTEETLPEDAEFITPEPVREGEDEPPAAPRIIPGKESPGGQGTGEDKRFLRLAGKFVNIEDLNMDLIDQINPFQGAYEILSKSVTAGVLKTIQDEIQGNRVEMTEGEATILWPKIKRFVKEQGRNPSESSPHPIEKRYAECLLWLKKQKRQRSQQAV